MMAPRAQVERRGEDPWAALEFLDQARRFLSDGQAEPISPEGRQVLLHNAAVAACDAVLAINGLEVTGSDGASEAVRELVALAGDLISPRLPAWHSAS